MQVPTNDKVELLNETTQALESWVTFDLRGLREMMENTASGLAEEIESRQTSRKALALQVKDLKHDLQRLLPAYPETVESIERCVSDFKLEVDATSKRAQRAEQAYLSLYRQLRDESSLQDPSDILRRVKDMLLAFLSNRSGLESKAELLVTRFQDAGVGVPDLVDVGKTGSGMLAKLEAFLEEEREQDLKVNERRVFNQIEVSNQLLRRNLEESFERRTSAYEAQIVALESALAAATERAEENAASVLEKAELLGNVERLRDERAIANRERSQAERVMSEHAKKHRDEIKLLEAKLLAAEGAAVEAAAAAAQVHNELREELSILKANQQHHLSNQGPIEEVVGLKGMGLL